MSSDSAKIVAVVVVVAILISLAVGLTTHFTLPDGGSYVHVASDYSAASVPSVDFVQVGLTGDIETGIIVAQLAEGEENVILGTSKGIYVLCPEEEESLQIFIPTPGSVPDIVLLDDVTADSRLDLAVITDDTYFPNVRCYDSATGDKVWDFAPRMEVFNEDLLWTEMQTQTFDIEPIADVDNDGYSDIAATSGYCLYLLSGKTGKQIWKYETEGNLWKVVSFPDIDNDDVQDIAVGAQDGFLHVVSGRTGEEVWNENVSEEVTVTSNEGSKYCTVDRSVWDIIPIELDGAQRAVVSSEDGRVRLLGLADGSVEWTSEPVIEHMGSALFSYYQSKSKNPSSPGDSNFFNLRITKVADVSGDDIPEFLVSAYVGGGVSSQHGQNESQTPNSELLLLDAALGEVMWKYSVEDEPLDLSGVAALGIAYLNGERVILVPDADGGMDLIDLEEGEQLEPLGMSLASTSYSRDEYWVHEFGEDKLLLVSDSQDLLCISGSTLPQIEWSYPRLTNAMMETGEFTGDDTPDVLIRSRHRQSGWDEEYTSRILYVVDGATGEKAWSYAMSYSDFVATEGIAGVTVTDDLNGDGKQDIVGYTTADGESKIIVFSGRGQEGNCQKLLAGQPVVEHMYYGIYDQLFKARDISSEALKSTVQQMLDKDIEQTYYDAFGELYEYNWYIQPGEAPFLKAQVDDFVDQILNDAPGGYDSNWPSEGSWMEDLESNLASNESEQRVNKQIQYLNVLRIPEMGGLVLLVETQNDLFYIHPATGEILCSTTHNAWCYEDPFLRISPESFGTDNYIRTLRALDDINDDGLDDVLSFRHDGAIDVCTTKIEDSRLGFEPEWDIQVGQGEWINQDSFNSVNDTDGDGKRDILIRKDRQDQSPVWMLKSSATGESLLETGSMGGSSNDFAVDWASADFNEDGYADHILYNKHGPVLEIISGLGGSTLWQYPDHWEQHFSDGSGFSQLTTVPAASVSDLNGDGRAELALIRMLSDQPGAELLIYDVSNQASSPLKKAVIEEVDSDIDWERRWQPGVSVVEVGDYTGDGHKEIAVVVFVGETQREKQAQLAIVDVVEERLVVDFRITGSQFIEMGQDKLGLIGLNGEVYYLDMSQDFSINSLSEGNNMTSPVTLSWTGTDSGAFSQIYVDDVQVAQTNDGNMDVDIAKGKHEVRIRSVDENGRGVWATTTVNVSKSSMPIAFAFAAFFSLVLVAIALMFHLNPLEAVGRLHPGNRSTGG